MKLARTIDWRFLEEKFGTVYADGSGQRPLPTRLMAGLAILKRASTSPTRRFASTVIETHITGASAGKSFSSAGCRSIAPR